MLARLTMLNSVDVLCFVTLCPFKFCNLDGEERAGCFA